MSRSRYYWPLAYLVCILLGLLTLTLRPYNWNPSALFHTDEKTADIHGVEKNFVILQVPGYDGEQYYQIARHMNLLWSPDTWIGDMAYPSSNSIIATPTIAYSYQRFLLPFTAYVLTAGHTEWLPWSFLSIQIISLLCAYSVVVRRSPQQWLYALAIALCPAAMVGLHFSLAEPLTLALLTTFLVRFIDRAKLQTLDVILLSLFVLTREINILFIGALFLYCVWKRRWQDCFLLIIPGASFIALHTLIYGIFREVPFLWSADKHALPLSAIFDVLRGAKGYNNLTLSSIALFLGFVLPGFVWSVWNLWKKKTAPFLPLFSVIFFGVMSLMPDHIWGSITSIGRVITPIYPLFLLQAAERDTLVARILTGSVMALGLCISLALALGTHPFILS